MLAGSLPEFSLTDIFQLLAATRKSGVLDLTGEAAEGRIWVVDGGIAHAVADRTRSPLAARLLHGGEIDADAAEALVAAQAADDPAALHAALAGAGVPQERIDAVIRDQVVDAVFDLSRWADGRFAFDSGRPVQADAARVLPAAEVLQAVQARGEEWDGIISRLPSPASTLAVVGRPPLDADGAVRLTAEQWEVLTLVDGVRTVAEVIALTGQGQFVVARLLAGLVATGLVQVVDQGGEEPLSHRRARLLADLEHRLLGAPASAAPTAPAASTAPTASTAGAAVRPAPDPARPTPEEDRQVTAFLAAGDEPDDGDGEDPQVDVTIVLGGGTSPGPRDAAPRDDKPVEGEEGGPQAPDSGKDLLSRLIDGVKGA